MNTGEKDHAFGSKVWRLLRGFLCVAFIVQPPISQQRRQTYELGLPFIGPVSLVDPDLQDSRNASTSTVVVPPGTILPVRLNSSLSSVKNKAGQAITARVMQDVPLPGGSNIHEGSKVIGHIVAVIPATRSARARVSLQFDKLVSSHRTTPITTNLRAIADFMEVLEAQTPQIGAGEGDVAQWQTTTQIGGDVVYGVGGPVTTAENAEGVVGSGVDSGVLVRVSAKKGSRCRGAIDGNENPQALWVFSSDACGTYGLEYVTIAHAGRTNPTGLITLTSDASNLKIRAGAGMLLRVNGVGG